MLASGGLSGGLSSSISEGEFWDGAKQGVIVAGLNHLAHAAIKAGNNSTTVANEKKDEGKSGGKTFKQGRAYPDPIIWVLENGQWVEYPIESASLVNEPHEISYNYFDYNEDGNIANWEIGLGVVDVTSIAVDIIDVTSGESVALHLGLKGAAREGAHYIII